MREKVIVDNVHIAKREEPKSKQLQADAFSNLYMEKGLVRPLYSLESLLRMREENPIHGACIDAKVADIAGMGFYFAPEEEIAQPNQAQYQMLKEFTRRANDGMTFLELLRAFWDDYETLGWGIIEIIRYGDGTLAELYHVPGHTVRAHRDGIRFAQHVDGTYRWFKRIGTEQHYDMETGEPVQHVSDEQAAGEVLVIRKYNSRSSFYGVPDYVTALGTIAGSQAVRDYNLEFFSGKTIPDTVLTLEGVDGVSDKVSAELKAFFSSSVKGQHHKLAILPLRGNTSSPVKANFQKITPDVKEASFRLYRHDNAIEICVAHRVPPYRIGWPIVGGLGGSTAGEMNEIYKRSVIEPGQEILEDRLNQQLFSLFHERLDWKFELNEIDLDDDDKKLEYNVKGVASGLLSPNEARANIGYERYPEGDLFYMPASFQQTGKDVVIKHDVKSSDED